MKIRPRYCNENPSTLKYLLKAIVFIDNMLLTVQVWLSLCRNATTTNTVLCTAVHVVLLLLAIFCCRCDIYTIM